MNLPAELIERFRIPSLPRRITRVSTVLRVRIHHSVAHFHLLRIEHVALLGSLYF
jgi:hypothetical protein